MRMRVVAATAVLGALLSAGTAQASFPGPNGRIAFTTDRDALDLEVYSMAADGSAQTNLTNHLDDDSQPAWSASGQKIAFTSFRDLDAEIYVMNADGTGQTQITGNPASDTAPAWSPDAGKIAFTSDRAGAFNLDIYVMNVDGSQQAPLTTDPGLDTGAAWSPVGSRIAFTSTRDGDSEIYVMSADGTGQARLTSNSASDVGPAWSPDGMKIAFRSKRDGNWEIYVMNADGTGQARLTSNSALEIDPDWQPAITGYARPKGATPLRASLVVAYQPCAAPNSTHGAPLSYGSCSPAVQTSPNLTVGTPDANGAAAQSIGSVRFKAIPGDPATPADEADVQITASITDVRCQAGASPCGPANARDGDDYTGEVQVAAELRITDKYNDGAPGGGTHPATGNWTFEVTVPCGASPTPDTVGSTCAITTTADAVYGDLSTAKEGVRAIWELGQVEVYDGGPDGIVSTSGNSLFEVQGVFVP